MIVFAEQMQSISPTLLRMDAEKKVVLLGDVVTMNANRDVIRNGRVCIDGNIIAAILRPEEPLPDSFITTTQVDTKGTIYPGLIDLHNHLTYNMIPLWSAPRRYGNRNTWREQEPSYKTDVSGPAAILSKNADKDYSRAIVRFAECRNLFGGVTSGQGMSMSRSNDPTGYTKYFEGLMRNVEHPLDAGWPAAECQTLDYLPAEIQTKLVPNLNKKLPFFYHVSEGTDADARQRFLDLQLPDGSWAINNSLICIHCVGLEPNDFDQLQAAAGIVWSPTSNMLLYGRTALVDEAKSRGVSIALGADWGPSGCKNLLGELKVARAISQQMGNAFSTMELVEMVTSVPARMVGWDKYVGSVSQGLCADLVVLEGAHTDPYAALIDARETSIRAILIDGRVRLAGSGFAVGLSKTCEVFEIGGKSYLIDLVEPQNDTMGGMSLATAIAKLSYGLQHLPELAASFSMKRELVVDDEQDWILDLEIDAKEDLMRLALSEVLAPDVKPMTLDPITSVDDQTFVARMKANPNLPDYVKTAF